MAGKLQLQSAAVIIKQAKEFHFFQLLQKLELIAPEHKKIFYTSHSLSFPTTDILFCCVDDAHNIIIELSFMGLHGVDSPLPHYFIMVAMGSDEKSRLMRNFLAIFNQRSYELSYIAWRKFKVLTQVSQKASAFHTYLFALAGFPLKNDFITAFCGLFGLRIHNSLGLMGMVREYLQTNVAIKSFVPQWLKQETVVFLGSNACLGNNIILGDKILDASNKIIITIGPMDLIKGTTLLPNKPATKKLHEMLQNYLPAVITYDICLTIIKSTEDFILGIGDVELGFMSWLGQPSGDYYNVQFSRTAVESYL